MLRRSVEHQKTAQTGTGSELGQSVAAGQHVHSSERQHQVDQQQGNSGVWLQPAKLGALSDEVEKLGSEPVGL